MDERRNLKPKGIEMTNYDVVKKLIGNIQPIGETNEDGRRLENLDEAFDVVENLVDNLKDVSSNADRVEHSMKEAGEKAENFLIKLFINLQEWKG